MSQAEGFVDTEVLVLGAGISGLVTAKCMKDVGFEVTVLERTGGIGGLWAYKDKKYGVMKFTHINVSKHNYSFSDFPVADDMPDYLHHEDLAQYIGQYSEHFGLDKLITFHTQAERVQRKDDKWVVETQCVSEDKDGIVTVTNAGPTYRCNFLAIATGHHSKPNSPTFPGLDTFTGKVCHSVDYKDAEINGLRGKRVVVVGIGNSAVDVACNAAAVARVKPVYLSSRSGAWVVPNYIFGRPTDHYACRLFLWLPWQLASIVFQAVITMISGPPSRWKLNPKMRALQTQPTVSPTLLHHIQRGEVKVVSNIMKVKGDRVIFADGNRAEADHLILCTGYRLHLPFLPESLRKQILNDDTNSIQLYKNVFAPEVGHSLAFVGFVQPASGGILTMSETQARWWAELCRKNVHLPTAADMKADIDTDLHNARRRWFQSGRHTIQRDPILYNDQIASFFGAKPQLTKHPKLAWRLLLGSGGASQWRLQGPGRWERAAEEVSSVPVTEFLIIGPLVAVLGLVYLLYCFLHCCGALV